MEKLNADNIIDDEVITYKEVTKAELPQPKRQASKYKETMVSSGGSLVNCLKNQRVIVRHIPKQSGMFSGKNHVFSGGMSENAVKSFTVPVTQSNIYINPLTDSERTYLEYIMGLEVNTLNIYNKVDNFWENFSVKLSKGDNYLDLSSPDDYIKYKVLLVNPDYIAPSLSKLEDSPKVTYQYVIINEGDEVKNAKSNLTITMQCYKEYGKIEEDADKLRTIIELIKGKPLAVNTAIEFLQTEINDIIVSDGKRFLATLKDEYLDYKVLIKKCINYGLIAKRGDYLYLKSDNSPLCDINEEPTFNVASKFLSLPKNQELKFALEAKLK